MIIKNDKIIARIDETGVTDGLVGWWSFNDNLNDVSGNGNNGTFYNGTVIDTPNYQTGIPDGGKGILFDGINDYVDCGNNVVGAKNMTISLWVKPAIGSVASGLVYKTTGYSASAENYYLFWWNSPVGLQFGSSDGINFAYKNIGDGNILLMGVWQLITVVKIATNLYLFRNGLLYASKTGLIENVQNTNIPLNIGKESTSVNRHFKGTVDDVRIYNRALTDKEIKQLCKGFKQ